MATMLMQKQFLKEDRQNTENIISDWDSSFLECTAAVCTFHHQEVQWLQYELSTRALIKMSYNFKLSLFVSANLLDLKSQAWFHTETAQHSGHLPLHYTHFGIKQQKWQNFHSLTGQYNVVLPFHLRGDWMKKKKKEAIWSLDSVVWE